ncbi:MAG TPA: sugar phosphate isomerase/epimerase family protein [Candidatus Angelobacter sp.]|nr:sugar phosphate isomerase/epimerase family protein [Candidatus Angelobacter sp.]
MYPFESRRHFLAALGGAAAASLICRSGFGASPLPASSSRFKLSVITDEITQDLGHALEIASREFGLGYVELRSLWNKNIINLDEKEMAEVRRLLQKYELQVTDIASPLFKTDWPGAPKSKYSPKKPQFGADYTFAQQGEVLERAIAAAKALGTDRVRCFDFWRLEDVKPFRAGMDDKLRETATAIAAKNITLLLENEFACNTATGAESGRTLQAVQSANFKLNWDPGNAAYRGETAYPDGFAKVPKERIGHMHCKDVKRKADGSFDWEAMGRGIIDYEGQFRAMAQMGYTGTVSLETHWRGAGSEEESSRQSMAGMKALLKKAGAF